MMALTLMGVLLKIFMSGKFTGGWSQEGQSYASEYADGILQSIPKYPLSH